MPTYQYTCTTCDHELEAVQSFTDDPLTECPECSGQLRKVFSAVGVVFKGSGFYRTDSRADSRTDKGNGSSDSKSSKGSEAKSDNSATSAASSTDSGSSTKTSSDTKSKQPSKANSAA